MGIEVSKDFQRLVVNIDWLLPFSLIDNNKQLSAIA